MPKAQVSFRDALPGAVIGGLLWEAVKYIRLEPELFSLRPDLWTGRGGRSCADLELRFQFDPSVWRPTDLRLSSRASPGVGNLRPVLVRSAPANPSSSNADLI